MAACCDLNVLQHFFTTEDFFKPCPRHAAAPQRDSQLNLWDNTAQRACCGLCVAEQPFHSVLQVRRSSYHDVVKIADIARLADIGGIQGYTINSSKVIFLRRRPQPRPPKGAVGASLCSVCSRHLQDVSHFCSLQCKLDCLAGVKNVSLRKLAPAAAAGTAAGAGAAGGLAAVACSVPGAGCAAVALSSSGCSSSSGAPETPCHPDGLRGLDAVTSSDSECMHFHEPATKRRKGCPLRAHVG